jgi:5'-nucleotidase
MRHITHRFLVAVLLLSLTVVVEAKKIKLVILHTNDTHSQVEPTDKSSLKTSDMGGYARRIGVINDIRKKEENVLLLDAGDFSQGTPYFNFFNGRVEVEALSRMKYDAGTLGNHEFDNGIDTLAVVLNKATFPLISSNYNVENTPLKDKIKPYLVLERFGLRIGIMALNIEPKGLIIESNYRGLLFEDPLKTAQTMAEFLKKDKKCDLIICLSHLGSDAAAKEVNDFQIARLSKYIDVIIGGHSHTMLENAKAKNALGRDVVIAQVGKSGLYLGKIELLVRSL